MRTIVPSISSLALLTALGTLGAQGTAPQHARADPGVQRDKNGKVKRSSTAKEQFERQSGYPRGRSGYVVDHVVPLAKGGGDSPSNMQWQTVAEAKAKDKVERGQKPKKTSTGTRATHLSRAPKGTVSSRGGFGSSARSSAS